MEIKMWFAILLTISLFVAFMSPSLSAPTPASTLSEEEGFQRFLENAMTEFPNWLRTSDLDPLPVDLVDLTIDISGNVSVTGNIRDQKLTGHSNITEFVTSQNFATRYMALVFPMENYTVEGIYNLEGLAYNASINGKGQFHFKADNEYNFQSYFILAMFDFGITADGYINISVAEKMSSWYGSLDGRVDFSGLNAGDYENVLIHKLKERIDEQWDIWFPIPDLLFQYMDDLFRVTPISEIINTTAEAAAPAAHMNSIKGKDESQWKMKGVENSKILMKRYSKKAI